MSDYDGIFGGVSPRPILKAFCGRVWRRYGAYCVRLDDEELDEADRAYLSNLAERQHGKRPKPKKPNNIDYRYRKRGSA